VATDGGFVLATDTLRAEARLAPFGVTWLQRMDGQWTVCCADRPTYAYAAAECSGRVVHSMIRDAQDQYFGLGDKTGPLDKHGRRLRTLQLDALGYNGETSDPLYKHWPFFLGRRRDSGVGYGVYYDTLSEATFDFGQEFDNYHGFYRDRRCGRRSHFYVFADRTCPPPSAASRMTGACAAAALDPRLREHRDGRDAADAQARSRIRERRAEHSLSAFHFGSGCTSRGSALRVHVEPRQVSRPQRRRCVPVCGVHLSPISALPARRSSGFPDKAQGGFVGDGKASLPRPVLGRLGRAPGPPSGRHRVVAARARNEILDYGIDAVERHNEFESGMRTVDQTASARRCPSRARGRCTRC
jgi:hypothetical protein